MSISNRLKKLMRNPGAAGLTGALAGGTLAALPIGKKTRRVLGGAAAAGGIGVLGSLAYKAYQDESILKKIVYLIQEYAGLSSF